MLGPELSIVIPAFNEAATIARVVHEHLATGARLAQGVEVLVLDDASTDGTWDVMTGLDSDARVHLIHHNRNLGIEPTLLELYSLSAGRWIYFAPGDGQVPAIALEAMWAARAGVACVVGLRKPRADPPMRRLLATMYSVLVRTLFGVSVRDIDSVKLIDARRFRALTIVSRSSFAEAEMLIRFALAGAVVREVEIPHLPRAAGKARGASVQVILLTMIELVRFRSSRR